MRRPISPRETMGTTKTTFTIPLKQTAKPVAFPADFKKHMELEFAMRYLTEVTHATTSSSVYSMDHLATHSDSLMRLGPLLAVLLVWE